MCVSDPTFVPQVILAFPLALFDAVSRSILLLRLSELFRMCYSINTISGSLLYVALLTLRLRLGASLFCMGCAIRGSILQSLFSVILARLL